jgi:hypothetical protein
MQNCVQAVGQFTSLHRVEKICETCGFHVDACARNFIASFASHGSRTDFLCSHNRPLVIELLLSGSGCVRRRFSTFPQRSSSQQALSFVWKLKFFCCDSSVSLSVKNSYRAQHREPQRVNPAFPQATRCKLALLGFDTLRKSEYSTAAVESS